MQLLTNHIGYELSGTKQAVLMSAQPLSGTDVAFLYDADSYEIIAEYPVGKSNRVANWHQGYFSCIDFSELTQKGHYYLEVAGYQSHRFEIGNGVLMCHTFSDLLHYFKSQRCSGTFDRQDRMLPLLGTENRVDVHGGWYDASGDVSKYLSHLSYTNYLNPQQTPMIVWNMLKGLSLLEERDDLAPFFRLRLTEEALFGADFLLRMQDPSGFFYMTVFDQWSKDVKQREICAYATQEGLKSDDYQAAFRQGGGMAIAALSSAARLDVHGEFTQQDYLQAATTGYWHLKEHNTTYLDNGEENIIDQYCALLASVELYRTTKENVYLAESREWALKLLLCQHTDAFFSDFWAVTEEGKRPYYHAAEAGLPVIALCEYLDIEPDLSIKNDVKSKVSAAISFEITVTQKVFNPFGYPRQYTQSTDGVKRDAFFMPHKNESEYWWQGENARLASLAVMALLAKEHVHHAELEAYTQNVLNWIIGLNPYDMCMLDGHGYNNPDYLPDLGFSNAKGGICNGITSGFSDEDGIAFNPPAQKNDILQNWRWGEQWIPHAGWYLLAITLQFAQTTPETE
ncbi:chitobiase [Vibrio albus]|uniref:Chitobiase n=1 Tax=Vibrio albus TaxID=2200953 RepID=A0A2U3B5P6_9VIBR|nr:glycoside hydrolase family 9 protein [Vibrio albus]PWI32092.1 chitobiase [Vibrio albus]